MLLGVIADDFTGATDIASFLVENGIATVQVNGVPEGELDLEARAVVVSLKTRSCPVDEAVEQALQALAWLQKQGCRQFYFKYCSTFDSTAQGNIGPVAEALMAALDESFTIFSPALPVNGRTVYQGYLFVNHQLLSESGMRHHPVTPMTDSYLPRLVEAQGSGRCGVVALQTLEQGAEATRQAIEALKQEGYRYAVLDAISERHLHIQGEALRGMRLVTGGSGLAAGLAQQWREYASATAREAGYPLAGRGVVLSGSCSQMTNRQVARYRQDAPARQIDVARCLDETQRSQYVKELADWVFEQQAQGPAPLVTATAAPEELAQIQKTFGAESASHGIEALFFALSKLLAERGIKRFIVAGGETSGSVTQGVGVAGFHIGPVISPGVPWVTALDQSVSLALKSGNFGDENFFNRAQAEFPV